MRLVLMTAARQATTEVLPALGLLAHQVRVVAPELSSLLDGDAGDVVLVDARHDLIKAGELVIDEHSYSAKLRGRPLDLTYKEFELLKYLAQHPGRVFSRAQLLQEIWGYDYFGGTRTVDVHVRRLRAKLGTEHEALIGTVRNVGYKLDQQDADATVARAEAARGEAGDRPAAEV